jgi:hypothetical protein
MKKSFPVLRAEFDAAVVEDAKLRKHIESLANSIHKRALPLTYKKAMTYLGKVVWSPDTEAWFLIEMVDKRKDDVKVSVIAVRPNSIVRMASYLRHPDDDFLSEEPAEYPEHFQAFVLAALKDCAKYYRLYNEDRNVNTGISALATAGPIPGSDKTAQK